MPGYKVCVVGGAGGIGQPLSMLMAMDPNVAGVLSFLTLSGHRGAEQSPLPHPPHARAPRPTLTPPPRVPPPPELCVYDLTIAMIPADGVAADLGHLNKAAKVKAYAFDKDARAAEVAGECLTGCDLVLVPAGVPRKPGQDRAALLNINAGIAKNIVEACAKFCPEAVIALIVNPVNSVVPAMCELWKKAAGHRQARGDRQGPSTNLLGTFPPGGARPVQDRRRDDARLRPRREVCARDHRRARRRHLHPGD